jgi:hypothetical protein
MAPVMQEAEEARGTTGMPQGATPSCLTTTLYDLMTTLQDVVGTTNDALVVTTVVQLVRSGRLTWCGKPRAPLNQAGRRSRPPGATASAGETCGRGLPWPSRPSPVSTSRSCTASARGTFRSM